LSFPRISARGVISVLPYKIKKDHEDELYRGYMARCARILTENTARLSGGGYLKVEYEDIINPKPQDTRTADEIVQDIIAQAGIEVITK
jgi:hypothetical protein